MSTKLKIDNSIVENWVSKNVKNKPAFMQDLELFLDNLSVKYQSAFKKSSSKSIHEELIEEMTSSDIDDKTDIMEKKIAQSQFMKILNSSLKSSSTDVKNLFSYLKKEASNLTKYSYSGGNEFQDSFPDYDEFQNEDKKNAKTAINIMRTYSEPTKNESKQFTQPKINFDFSKNTERIIEGRGASGADNIKPRLSLNNSSDEKTLKPKADNSKIKLPNITRS